MATKEEIAKLVRGLEGSYPGQCAKWSEALWAQVYHNWNELLAPVPLPQLEAASKYCALTEKWFPQPSQIVDAMVHLGRMVRGVPDKIAAWKEARKLAAKQAWWSEDGKELVARDVQESDCSHPLVYASITSYGLRELRQSDNGAPDRKHFWDTYERLCDREEEMDIVATLLPEMQGVPRLISQAQPAIAEVAEPRRF